MKLLSLEIGALGEDDSGKERTFRSLHSGFYIQFHSLSKEGITSMGQFEPFCFAGLNGSGKSNVLEALASIFFHLECCVAKFNPLDFKKHFKRNEATLDAFTLKYIISGRGMRTYSLNHSEMVVVSKVAGEDPKMWVEPTPFNTNKSDQGRDVSLIPPEKLNEPAEGKIYLPDLVVGYSSGENEILSLPFLKNRLIQFDEYREASFKGLDYHEPETSLIYIDEEMSQAVLLSCLLMENETTLKPLKDILGIEKIESFRMNINMKQLQRVNSLTSNIYQLYE